MYGHVLPEGSLVVYWPLFNRHAFNDNPQTCVLV